MVRSVTPTTSAASHHFSLPAIAFSITSCTFITRSISAAGQAWLLCSTTPSITRRQSGQLTCQFDRTDHMLLTGSFVNGAVPGGMIYSGYPVVKFAFIGNAAGAGGCTAQSPSPNGDTGADSMISVMAHELS